MKRIKYSVPEFVYGQNRGEFFRFLDLKGKNLRIGGRHEGEWLYECPRDTPGLGGEEMRRITAALAVVGVIVFMSLSVGAAAADELACMTCKALAQGACLGSGEITRTADWEQRCINEYIAEKCADACQKKSDKDD